MALPAVYSLYKSFETSARIVLTKKSVTADPSTMLMTTTVSDSACMQCHSSEP